VTTVAVATVAALEKICSGEDQVGTFIIKIFGGQQRRGWVFGGQAVVGLGWLWHC
jgi:hypothetical protein